jgi:ethanolamine utilization protein EutP (predicted NTPase)
MSEASVAAVMTRLCDHLSVRVPDVAPVCGRIKARVEAPLRVAFVGRANAGKSTLVNALLGRRIAPTPVSELTRVPTWFSFGTTDTAAVVARDDAVRPLAFAADGCLPMDLRQAGLPVSAVKRIDVTLHNQALRDLVLIDTPGLGAINQSASAMTLELLTASGADAVIFVFSQTLTGEDRAVIDDFAQAAGGPWNSPVRMIAVLSKADLLADDGGELGPARRVGQRFAASIRHRAVSVLPVVGLLAETVRCGLLTEAMVREIEGVARAPDRRLQLASPARFAARSDPRKDVVERLSTVGLAASVAFVNHGGGGAGPLAAHLADLSGIESLETMVSRRFRESAAVLQVERGLRELEGVAADRTLSPADSQTVRNLLDDARLDPAMHRLDELEAEETLLRGDVTFRADRVSAALRILGPGSAAERLGSSETDPVKLADLGRRATEEWHETAVVSVDAGRKRVASSVSLSAHLLCLSLTAQP